VLVEVLGDRRFALPPLDHPRALGLLGRLRARPLLDGVRARPRPTWTRSPTLARFSALVAVDVNPVVAGPGGGPAVEPGGRPDRLTGSMGFAAGRWASHDDHRRRETPMTEQDSSMTPGDEAPPGTEGTGENLCPDCSGSGQVDGQSCQTCGGSGRVVQGVSGA
jgi:hypothetical protein